MNNDRITEVYEGTHGSLHQQRIARDRIHWIGRQVRGDRVLDIGCSQGVMSLLIAREGRQVVGVDNEEAAIRFARERLEREEPVVRDRVSFELGEGSRLAHPDESFDSVILGEILEHQMDYRPLLAEACRLLRPGGTVVITTPYGYFPYHDHKAPIYLASLIPNLVKGFEVETLELIERYLAIVALRPSEARTENASIWRTALGIAEQRVSGLESQDEDHRTAAAASRIGADALEQVRAELAAVTRRAEDSAVAVERMRVERDTLAAHVTEVERGDEAKDRRLIELEDELARVKRELAEVTAKADAYEQQVRRLAEDRAGLLADLERLAAAAGN